MHANGIVLRPQVFGSFSREDLDQMIQVEWLGQREGMAAEEAALVSLRADGIAWLDAHPGATHVQIEDGEIAS